MHVPDGFINAPVSAATGLISLGTIWAYIRNAKNLVADRLIALTGNDVSTDFCFTNDQFSNCSWN